MEINVQEFYQQTVRPLPERERLTLATLILQDISQTPSIEHPKRRGALEELFGTGIGGGVNGSDNEQIDRDLARAYANEFDEQS
ncbi:MAG: hypothetical protein AB7P14_16325 [Blastocatellales bacterium]